jgi:hypothetical protein
MNRFTNLNQDQFHRLWIAKTISDVAVGQDINWICVVVFEFLAELTDENALIPDSDRQRKQ